MNERRDAELMRLLTGDLKPEERAVLEKRIQREPDMAERMRVLEGDWRRLELPPPSPPPLGSRARIVARAREIEEDRAGLDWHDAPVWARASGALALTVGILLGVAAPGFEIEMVVDQAAHAPELDVAWDGSLEEKGLAELYADALQQSTWDVEEEDGS